MPNTNCTAINAAKDIHILANEGGNNFTKPTHVSEAGWFHGEFLQPAGWSKPRRSQKNWLCQSCHVFENGM